MLEIGHNLSPRVVEQFPECRIISDAHFAPMLSVGDMQHFNGVGED